MLYLCHFRMLMNHIQVMLFYHYVNMDQELIQATDESRLWNNSLILFLTHLTSRVKPRKILIRHMKFFSGIEVTSIILNEVHMQRKGWEHPIASLVAAGLDPASEPVGTRSSLSHKGWQNFGWHLRSTDASLSYASNCIPGLEMESLEFITSLFFSFIHSTIFHWLPAMGQGHCWEPGVQLTILFLASRRCLPSQILLVPLNICQALVLC